MWESDLIFGSNGMTNDDFVDVIELIPIFVIVQLITKQRFKLRSTWYRHVQGFSGVEALFVKKVVVVFVS